VKDSDTWHAQMISMMIADIDADQLHRSLLEKHSIEVLTETWQNNTVLRFSFQAYNLPADGDRLSTALAAILK
jgi:selenocysteine lyase/cysteine desulfurase